ncbi:holo-ACP synthase [Nostoc sp. C117]|uniref:holo-ACP synthase n=1 Tax=Nostoc sp. C117 TaxID=3349875 RepID=UPI00370DB654
MFTIESEIPVNLLTFEPDALKVIGHSINIVTISSIKKLIEPAGRSFEMQWFTERELSASGFGNHRIQYLAGRFCVKKAVLQILGVEYNQDCFWLDLEVQRLSTGKPAILLDGKCQEIAVALGITKWLVSISHVSSYATASAIAL